MSCTMRDTGGREQGASRAKPAEEGAGPPRRGLGTPINYLDFWGIALKYFQFRFTVSGYFLPRVKDSPARAIETVAVARDQIRGPCRGERGERGPWC